MRGLGASISHDAALKPSGFVLLLAKLILLQYQSIEEDPWPQNANTYTSGVKSNEIKVPRGLRRVEYETTAEHTQGRKGIRRKEKEQRSQNWASGRSPPPRKVIQHLTAWCVSSGREGGREGG